MNVLFPGMGTIIASTLDKDGFNKIQFWIGVAQFFTSVFFTGWIWSIWWGCLILDKSEDDDESLEDYHLITVRTIDRRENFKEDSV